MKLAPTKFVSVSTALTVLASGFSWIQVASATPHKPSTTPAQSQSVIVSPHINAPTHVNVGAPTVNTGATNVHTGAVNNALTTGTTSQQTGAINNTVDTSNRTVVLPNGGSLTINSASPGNYTLTRWFLDGTGETISIPQEVNSFGIQLWVVSAGASNNSLSDKDRAWLEPIRKEWDAKDAKIRSQQVRDRLYAKSVFSTNPFTQIAIAESEQKEAFDGTVSSYDQVRTRAEQLLKASATIEGLQKKIARISQEREAVRNELAQTDPSDSNGTLARYDRVLAELNAQLKALNISAPASSAK